MIRDYLRITPSSERLDPEPVASSMQSLYELSDRDKYGTLARLNPFSSDVPVAFEFLAISEGPDEPVEFYFSADARLDVLEQRFHTIYLASFDIDRVEVDPVRKLLRTVEYIPSELRDRLTESRLYDPEALEKRLTNNELRSSRAGTVEARPPLSEVEPYGVEWWGAAARRKDWMTTLTGFTEVLGQDIGLANEDGGQSQLPLTPLVKQLAEAKRPLAFQVVFQRRSDWSRDARRRAGELLDGSDTLLQKVLGLESQGSRRRSGSGRSPHQSTRRTSRSTTPGGSWSPAGGGPARPTNVEEASRYDLVQGNSPKRTFSVNLRLLTLTVNGDEIDGFPTTLGPMRSVFDLVDGPFYEMDGRRLRAHGYLPGSGQRHARNVLDRFDSRSISTGVRRIGITNRSETRPDLVLNGDELASFVVVPPMSEPPIPDVQEDTSEDKEPAESPKKETEATTRSAPAETGTQLQEATGRSLPDAPTSAIHRDAEVHQLTAVLEPLTEGSEADTVLVTGPTGSGKTHAVKYAVDQLCQQNPGLNAVYVNCWEDHSPFQTLNRILDQLESTVDIHRKSTPRDVLLDRLRTHDDQPCVAILDEVDQLDEKDLLYDFLNLPGFSLLLIVNREEDLLEGIDQRLASRLGGCERISFDRYTVDELVDILRESTDSESVSEDSERRELKAIANAVNGDARVAISTLRIATRRAGGESDGQISEDIVEDALPKARQEVRLKNIDGLTPDQRAVFRVIEENGRISPGEIIDKYRERVEEPKSNRTIRNYLNKLERYDLIASEGSTRDRMYRCISP